MDIQSNKRKVLFSTLYRHVHTYTTCPSNDDTRGGDGGAGAIDLACHCLHLSFKQAVRLLRERGL